MKRFDRRTLLRYSGMAAASLALHSKGIAWTQTQQPVPLANTMAGRVSGAFIDGVNVFKAIP